MPPHHLQHMAAAESPPGTALPADLLTTMLHAYYLTTPAWGHTGGAHLLFHHPAWRPGWIQVGPVTLLLEYHRDFRFVQNVTHTQ